MVNDDKILEEEHLRVRFVKTAKTLNNILKKLRKIHPKANIYVDGNAGMNLMLKESQNPDDVAEEVNFVALDGGDW